MKVITQGFALKQFGDDVGRAFVLADVENRNNIGVVERGSGLGLQLEPAETSGSRDHAPEAP